MEKYSKVSVDRQQRLEPDIFNENKMGCGDITEKNGKRKVSQMCLQCKKKFYQAPWNLDAAVKIEM